jgi:glycosyltransferase involved in cell wall biosynthesis
MLVTKVGGLPEIVPHMKTGYVVDVDTKAIADGIIDFYTNERETDFTKNCIEEKKKYTWETLLSKIQSLFPE